MHSSWFGQEHPVCQRHDGSPKMKIPWSVTLTTLFVLLPVGYDPTCLALNMTYVVFVEIGSSEEHWGRADAAEVWADVLTR